MADTAHPAQREWLCLLFALPTKQAHARVQAWRRLQRAGAVLLKNSAYVLPASTEGREDLEWIKQEIVSSGGQAMGLAARAPDAPTEADSVAAFRAARSGEFEGVTAAATKPRRLRARGSARRPGPQ